MKLRQNSQKNSFGQSLYSGGKGEKYQVSISYLPSSIFAIFFTLVNSSCSLKLAASSSS
uniref:Ham101 n=1 Tax=Arundo donax TaxID=35708 RepID=A0A0A9P277_ARUDO